MTSRCAAGVDVGSLTIKVVVLAEDGRILGRALRDTTPRPADTARSVLDEALKTARLEEGDLAALVGTGYGRAALPFATRRVTEITCHARGAGLLVPGARLVLDVGGQDSKAIRLEGGGRVEDFAMNDKCAAGTGRFLGVMAQTLGTGLDGLGPAGMKSGRALAISSTCTVFAESEVVSLVAQGEGVEDIAHAVHTAMARRLAAMVRQVGVAEPAVFTGGGALNPDLVLLVGEFLSVPFIVPPEPQFVGALGAASLGLDPPAGRGAGT